MDPTMNKTELSLGPHGVYIQLEKRQTLQLPWRSVPRAVIEELLCTKEGHLAGGQRGLSENVKGERGLATHRKGPIQGTREDPYSGVENMGENKLRRR